MYLTEKSKFQYFVDWKINIHAKWPCLWLEYHLPRLVRKVKQIEHNNYSKNNNRKRILPRIWQFSHTTPHMSLWVEDKRTLNLPSLCLTTIQIPPWSLGSEMMNEGSWYMARQILGCSIQLENKSQEMWGQDEHPALQQDSFAHIHGHSPPAALAASRVNISVLWW